MESSDSIQGSQPLSRYGDRRVDDLTLGITRGTPARHRVGSTELSRFFWTGLLPPRAMLLTRQGISLTLLPVFPHKVKWGPDISAGLCMSPYRSDCLLSNCDWIPAYSL